jgi:hypothetical protein
MDNLVIPSKIVYLDDKICKLYFNDTIEVLCIEDIRSLNCKTYIPALLKKHDNSEDGIIISRLVSCEHYIWDNLDFAFVNAFCYPADTMDDALEISKDDIIALENPLDLYDYLKKLPQMTLNDTLD